MPSAVVEEAIRLAIQELAPAKQDRQQRVLERERAEVHQECARLAEAIGRGGPLDALVARLAERQARQTAIEQELTLCQRTHHIGALEGLEARLRAKLADWRALLRRNVTEGREVLEHF